MSDFRLDQMQHDIGDLKGMLVGLARKRAGTKPPIRQTLIRAITALALAEVRKQPVSEIIKSAYRDDQTLHLACADLGAWHAKAATSPAQTTVTGWASEVVELSTYTGLLPALAPTSVFSRLQGLGLGLSRGAAGGVKLPYPNEPASMPPLFVGEAQAIPVVAFNLGAAVVLGLKAALMVVYSSETAERSVPDFEVVLRRLIEEQVSIGLDAALLSDAPPVNGVSPAGLLFGLTPIAASAAADAATAAYEDVRSLLSAFVPEATSPLLVTGTASAVSLGMLYPQSGLSIATTNVLPPGRVIAIDGADFASLSDSDGEIVANQQAMVQLLDNPASADIMVSAPVMDLWQTDSRAIRLIETIGYGMRRPGRVFYIDGVTW